MAKTSRNILRRIGWTALVMLLALSIFPQFSVAQTTAAPKRQKPAGRIIAAPRPGAWTRVVMATPQGGMRIGNPSARIRLVEYGSLTCHVCGAFANESGAVLINRYVASGKVSFEFRSYPRNAVDVAGSLGMACLPARAYFPFLHNLFANQPAMLAKLEGMTDAQQQRLNMLPMVQQLRALSDIAGLTPMFAAAGIDSARLDTCLANKASLNRLEASRQEVETRHHLEGTPFFLLNDAPLRGVTGWSGVEAALKSLGA